MLSSAHIPVTRCIWCGDGFQKWHRSPSSQENSQRRSPQSYYIDQVAPVVNFFDSVRFIWFPSPRQSPRASCVRESRTIRLELDRARPKINVYKHFNFPVVFSPLSTLRSTPTVYIFSTSQYKTEICPEFQNRQNPPRPLKKNVCGHKF